MKRSSGALYDLFIASGEMGRARGELGKLEANLARLCGRYLGLVRYGILKPKLLEADRSMVLRVRMLSSRDPAEAAFWMAGGGIQPGISYGASDELAMNAVEKPVHIHDLQATILHQLGIDHERLTYKFQGRYYRLTDVHGQVVRDILS